MDLDERFESDELDRSVWVPWYLPHWSSRAASAATYEVGGGELRLSIPADQPLWAEGVHETPTRVSGIQSANYSLEFTVDGATVKRVGQAPHYPVQLEIAVFDFPDRAHLVDGAAPVPELIVANVRGRTAA